jgi:hypothetical protein
MKIKKKIRKIANSHVAFPKQARKEKFWFSPNWISKN